MEKGKNSKSRMVHRDVDAAARRSDDRKKFPRLDVERNILHRHDLRRAVVGVAEEFADAARRVKIAMDSPHQSAMNRALQISAIGRGVKEN